MKSSHKFIAIFLIAILIIVFFKNRYIESILADKFLIYNFKAKRINCQGFSTIDCTLDNLYTKQTDSSIVYTFLIEKLYLKNIFNIYKFFDLEDYNANFNIKLENLKIEDNKKVLQGLLCNINIELVLNEKKLFLNFINKEKIDFNISFEKNKKENVILTVNIKDKFITKLFYKTYILQYLKIKEEDGTDFAKGINLSLGIYSDNIIDENDFMNISLPIASDLFIGEIESYEIIAKNNENMQISNLLNGLLMKEGKMSFKLSLNYEGLKNE